MLYKYVRWFFFNTQHNTENMGKKGKKSKKKTTTGGIATTRLLELSMEYFAQVKELNSGQEERRRCGTSAVITDNVSYHGRNDEAQKLNNEAHRVKKAGDFQRAHELLRLLLSWISSIIITSFNVPLLRVRGRNLRMVGMIANSDWIFVCLLNSTSMITVSVCYGVH